MRTADGQFGKSGAVLLWHSIRKDNRLSLFFHRCLPQPHIFYVMASDKIKAQMLDAIKILWFGPNEPIFTILTKFYTWVWRARHCCWTKCKQQRMEEDGSMSKIWEFCRVSIPPFNRQTTLQVPSTPSPTDTGYWWGKCKQVKEGGGRR